MNGSVRNPGTTRVTYKLSETGEILTFSVQARDRLITFSNNRHRLLIAIHSTWYQTLVGAISNLGVASEHYVIYALTMYYSVTYPPPARSDGEQTINHGTDLTKPNYNFFS